MLFIQLYKTIEAHESRLSLQIAETTSFKNLPKLYATFISYFRTDRRDRSRFLRFRATSRRRIASTSASARRVVKSRIFRRIQLERNRGEEQQE